MLGTRLVRAGLSCVSVAQRQIHHHKEAEFSMGRYLGYRPWHRKRKGNRHRDEKFRDQRQLKFLPIRLPDFESQRRQERGEMSIAESKKEVKAQGMMPPRSWGMRERPFHVFDSGMIFDDYIPPEGDARASLLSVKEKGLEIKDRFQRRMGKHIKAIKKILPDWDVIAFAPEAQDIYIKAHNLLAAEEKDAIHDYVTDFAFPKMWGELKLRSLRWRWVETLEAPRVVHVSSQTHGEEANNYTQVTVRLHSTQTLALYDQWGRLLLGSPDVAQEVVEYPIFERHLSDPNSRWRIHGKIRPRWDPKANRRYPLIQTFPKKLEEEAQKKTRSDPVLQRRHGWKDAVEKEDSA